MSTSEIIKTVFLPVTAEVAWGYLTKAFRWRLEPGYQEARDFHNGLAAVKQDGQWGFIYANGRWAIEPQFDEAGDFDDAVASNDFEDPSERDRQQRGGRNQRLGREIRTTGLYAPVKIDGHWGYVNRAANGGLTPQFDRAEPFYLGLARVARGDENFAYISETGQVLFDPLGAERGIINRTARDLALQDAQRERAPRANSIVPSPPYREQADVPYKPESEYEEVLPVPED